MRLGPAPTQRRLQISLQHYVEIVEIARAPLQPARYIGHHFAGIGDLQQHRPLRLVNLSRRMDVRMGSPRQRIICRSGQQ